MRDSEIDSLSADGAQEPWPADSAEALLREIAGSGIEWTNAGRYHVVQIDIHTWDEVQRIAALQAPAASPAAEPHYHGDGPWHTAEACWQDHGAAAEGSEPLDVERLALALQESDHGTAYHDKTGRRVAWDDLDGESRESKRRDARNIAAAYASQTKKP